jgi:hypothetical protein
LPAKLSISHGGIINDKDFIVFGGYENDWTKIANQVYAYDLSNQSSIWRNMDPIPNITGITHASFVIVADTMYVCGGFINIPENIPTSQCWLYRHTKSPGYQWQSFPSLPAARAGGALLYHRVRNTLLYTSGTEGTIMDWIDHNDVWEYKINNPFSGWKNKSIMIPYRANRVSYVTVNYAEIIERQYVMGGQNKTNEQHENYDTLYEYIAHDDSWIKRSNIPQPLSHFTSGTIPYKTCGFIIANGNTNNGQTTSAIHYYAIHRNRWTKIGDLPKNLRSSVCQIYDDYLYCQTGELYESISWRSKILTIPSPVPVPIPAPKPISAPSSSSLPTEGSLKNGRWIETNPYDPSIDSRHEACFVMVGRKAVLIGGRYSFMKPPNIYDPITRTWKDGSYPPNNIELHHMQCVVVQNKVWIVNAWTGGYPYEENAPNIFILYRIVGKHDHQCHHHVDVVQVPWLLLVMIFILLLVALEGMKLVIMQLAVLGWINTIP